MPEPLEPTTSWTFEKGEERIVVRCPSPARLVVAGRHPVTRQIDFSTVVERVAFQSGFETHLLNAGWTLAAFTPAGHVRSGTWWSRLLQRWRGRHRRGGRALEE